MQSVLKAVVGSIGFYWQVLTTEWIDGVQLAKSPPDVINGLIPIGVECFLTQLLELGFFQ